MALKDDAAELKGILGDLKNQMDQINQSGGGVADGLRESKGAMEELLGVAQEYANTYQKEKKWYESRGKLSTEELTTLQEKLKTQKELLQSASKKLKSDISSNVQSLQKLRAEKESLKAIKAGGKGYDDAQSKLKEINSEYDDIRSQLNEQIKQNALNNKLLEDAEGEISDIEKGLKKATKESKGLDGMKKLGGALDGVRTPLDGMLNPLNLINQLIGFIFGTALELDTQIGDTAKSMNMTYSETVETTKAMNEAARESGELLVNTESINRNVVALNKEMGTNVPFERMSKSLQDDVMLMGKLQNSAGLTADETNAIMKFSAATGKTGKETFKQFSASFKMQKMRRGLVLNEKDAMKEIGKLSSSIKLSISGGAEGLGKAMVAAKALGTDLGKVDDIAGSLLNFEESIANELEAELLTGKELNLEKARQAALDNDLATLADEIAKNVGTAADFNAMNRIQQEAIAKSVGMTREELASSLMEQENLARLSEVEGETLKAKYETMRLSVEKGGEGLSAAEAAKKLGDEALATQLEQASTQEKAQLAQQKMADETMPAILGTLKSVNQNFEDAFNKVKNIINSLGGMKTILIGISLIIGAKMVKGVIDFASGTAKAIKAAKALQSTEKAGAITSIIKGAWSSLGPIPFVGAALAVAAIGTGIGYLISQIASADDMFSPGGSGGGYGNRTLLGPEGAIALNNKDDIIAGTDLFKKGNDVTSEGGGATKTGAAGTVSIGSDMSSVVAAINSLGAKVEAMANRPINVGMDGQKVIEAGTGNNPNTFGEEVGKNSFDLQ
jgi:hypothetical protein